MIEQSSKTGCRSRPGCARLHSWSSRAGARKNSPHRISLALGRNERLPELAAELVRLKVDVIVANETPDTRAAKNATKAIPIVMAAPVNPVGAGLIESLARPGGNVTGLSQMASELVGKRLALLKEMVPKLARVAVLRNPQNVRTWEELQLPARQLGVQLHSMGVRGSDDFDKAFDDAIKARADALYVIGFQAFFTNLKRIVDFAAKNRLPSMFPLPEFVDRGVSRPMGQTVPTCSGAPPLSWTRYSKARNPPTFRSSNPPSSNW